MSKRWRRMSPRISRSRNALVVRRQIPFGLQSRRRHAVVLVDSSVWFLRLPRVELMGLANGGPIAICAPVVQELMQGAYNEQRMQDTRAIIEKSDMLDIPVPLARFEFAGEIFRTIR